MLFILIVLIKLVDVGKLEGIMGDLYVDDGSLAENYDVMFAPEFIDNVYSCQNWLISLNTAKTNTANNTAVRSPGIKYKIHFLRLTFMETFYQDLNYLYIIFKKIFKFIKKNIVKIIQ